MAICGGELSGDRSKVSAPALALPIAEAGWFETFDLNSVLFSDVIVLVGESIEALHHMVLRFVVFAILRKLSIFEILLLL